jgi:hypothetical protein
MQHQARLIKTEAHVRIPARNTRQVCAFGADDMCKMQTWVDASYAVHEDMKSHKGGIVSFGRRAAMSKSSNQKLNTKSSTEAELVGASDYLPYLIWAKKLLEAKDIH